MHKVKMINEQESLVPTHIYIDDTEVYGVKKLEYFKTALDELPVFKFEVSAIPEIIEIGKADIQFQFTPQTIKEAAEVVRHTMITDEYSYSALVACISSVLKENPEGTRLYDVAKAVADRIIGKE